MLALTLGVLAACAGTPPGLRPRAEDDPHRNVACLTCHDGPLVDRNIAQASTAGCTAAGCHSEGGPERIRLAAVSFQHRDHGGDATVATGCAGCHTHLRPEAPLTATVDACSFCHLSQQAAGSAGECRLCHSDLTHAGTTSQGVAVPHQNLPWLDGGCVRCHYDVTEPPVELSPLRCGACHTNVDGVVEQSLGEDLHPSHTTASCVSCHGDGAHRIRAMSSSVALSCVDCHRREHDIEVTAAFPDALTCNRCHTGAHEAQQRMVLGLVADLPTPAPAAKFLAGLTCRSCHQPTRESDPAVPVRGNVDTCVECHRSEYRVVARWWRDGSAERLRRAMTYARTAEGRLGEGAGPEAAAELAAAGRMLTLVETAGGVHNLRLAHQLLGAASERVGQAYTLAGRAVPPPPALGREPSMGLCSFCHYRADDQWSFGEMSGPFHRDVLRLSGGGDRPE